jgi:putative flippase GtrA
LYLLITYLGVEPKLAMSLLYLIVASTNFIGNRQWTFTHKGALLGSGSRYLIAHAFGYVLNFFILLVFVDMLGYPHQWVQAVAIFVVAGFLFVSLKLFVFPASPGYGRAIEK